MELALNINDRIRKYGYIFWTKENDFEIYELLGKRQEIDVVVDGKEGEGYDCIVSKKEGDIVFDSSDSFHYLAAKGSVIYLVEERVSE